MSQEFWGDPGRKIILSIDRWEDQIFSGRVYLPDTKEGAAFRGVYQFLELLEREMDQCETMPRATLERREFVPIRWKEDSRIPVTTSEKRGELATFELELLYRQHATWQGTVRWVEQERREAFRSALELLHLLGSALEGQE